MLHPLIWLKRQSEQPVLYTASILKCDFVISNSALFHARGVKGEGEQLTDAFFYNVNTLGAIE